MLSQRITLLYVKNCNKYKKCFKGNNCPGVFLITSHASVGFKVKGCTLIGSNADISECTALCFQSCLHSELRKQPATFLTWLAFVCIFCLPRKKSKAILANQSRKIRCSNERTLFTWHFDKIFTICNLDLFLGTLTEQFHETRATFTI